MQEPTRPLQSELPAATAELIQTYHEVNHPPDEFAGDAKAADFLRNIRLNRPFCVRQGCAEWPALRRWNAGYLQERMGDRLVQVAQTPLG